MFYLWDGFLLLLAKYSILCSLGKLRTAHNHCQKHQSNEMVPPVSLMVCGLAKIDSPFGLPLPCFYPLLWSAPPPRILPCHQQNSLNWKTCRANLFVFKWHWSHTRLISCHHLLRLSIWTYKDGISNFLLRKHHSSTCLPVYKRRPFATKILWKLWTCSRRNQGSLSHINCPTFIIQSGCMGWGLKKIQD